MLFTQCCVLASGLQYGCRRVHYITWECILDFSGTHACLEAVMMVMQALCSVLPAYFIMIYKESSKFRAVHFFILFVVCESVCPTTKGISISLNSLCSISCWYSALHILSSLSCANWNSHSRAANQKFFGLQPCCAIWEHVHFCITLLSIVSPFYVRLQSTFTDIVLWMVQLVFPPSSSSPSPSPEYDSDPLGAFNRDLSHPAGVLCPLPCCLHFLSGSALLSYQEETQRQIGEILTRASIELYWQSVHYN